jgi:hypothetical protein
MKHFVFIILLAHTAAAQNIFAWEDASGMHFTDDPSSVPVKFRSKAALLKGLDRAPLTETGTAVSRPAAPSADSIQRSREEESLWRQRFIGAQRRIEALQHSIEVLRQTLPPRLNCLGQPAVFGRMAPPLAPSGTVAFAVPNPSFFVPAVQLPCALNEVYDRQQARIAEETVALVEAKKDLEALDRQASLDGIPREWRRGW